MEPAPKPPATYEAFRERFPGLGQAWDLLAEAGRQGPLDETTVRLVRLAVAMGALREGAVHAGVRKALAQGIPRATPSRPEASARVGRKASRTGPLFLRPFRPGHAIFDPGEDGHRRRQAQRPGGQGDDLVDGRLP
jgi:hypothetical protein